jgi:hypothetical protein
MFKDKKMLIVYAVIVVAVLCLPFACAELKECTRSGMVSLSDSMVWVKLSCVF